MKKRQQAATSVKTLQKALGMHGNPRKSHDICENVEYEKAATSRDKR